MNYIIDGHNLIAQIPGLSLEQLDDEDQLIGLLNQYGEQHRGKLEVYFDRAPFGQAGIRTLGRVRAHFVSQGSTADEAIRLRLAKLGKSAREWRVVSSDRDVQAEAREVHSKVIKAEEFARQLMNELHTAGDAQSRVEKPLSQAELDEWLTIFKARKKPNRPHSSP